MQKGKIESKVVEKKYNNKYNRREKKERDSPYFLLKKSRAVVGGKSKSGGQRINGNREKNTYKVRELMYENCCILQ